MGKGYQTTPEIFRYEVIFQIKRGQTIQQLKNLKKKTLQQIKYSKTETFQIKHHYH